MKHVSNGNFIFQHDGALVFIVFNAIQLLQCKIPIYLSFLAVAPKWSTA